MPVTGSIHVFASRVSPRGFGEHAGHAGWPAGIRRLQLAQTSRVSHSGQIFQLGLTSISHFGQMNRPSGVSQAGQIFQVFFTASPQEGHWHLIWFSGVPPTDVIYCLP
jgi:hypothetical protein